MKREFGDSRNGISGDAETSLLSNQAKGGLNFFFHSESEGLVFLGSYE